MVPVDLQQAFIANPNLEDASAVEIALAAIRAIYMREHEGYRARRGAHPKRG